MKRGDIVLFRETGSPASKSRPCVIVQDTTTLPGAAKITAVPLTSELTGLQDDRPLLAPNARNGLRKTCKAQVDWVYTFRRSRIGPKIGEADTNVMPQIDDALRRWLAL